MTEILSCLQSFLCFLCFFQVFLQLAPKENDRKYLKLFGNLVLVLLVLRPVTAVFGKADSLDQILKRNDRTAEGSEVLWNYAKKHWIEPNLEKGRIQRGKDL